MKRRATRITIPDSWLAGLWFSLLALGLSWPMVLQPGGQALGHLRADGMKHLWTLWWMQASIWQEGSLPFHTRLINFPVGMDLYPIEPLNGLLAVLMPFAGVVLLSNLLVLVNMTLTGLLGAWFGKEVSGSVLGGFVAGTLLEGSAVMAFFVHVGVGELTHLWWLPLGLGCLLRARKTLELRWFLALAACLAGSVLSCFYLGFFLALAVAVYALVTLWNGLLTRRLLGRYAVAAGLSLLVVLPVTHTFASSYRSKDEPEVGLVEWVTGEHGQSVTDPASARLHPRQLFQRGRVPGSWEEAAYGGGRFIGFAAAILAIIGLLRSPRQGAPWLLIALLCALFAMGSYYTVNGEPVAVNGSRLRLPLFYLNRLLGYVAEPLNFPIRFLAMTVTALSALAALAFRAGPGRWYPWAALLMPISVLEVASGDMLPWPWDRFVLPTSPALDALREEPTGAVIDLALLLRPDAQNRLGALSNQIAHGRATQAVPIERIEFFARDGLWFVRTLPLIADIKVIYDHRAGALTGDYRRDVALLRDAGFLWILVYYPGEKVNAPYDMVNGLTTHFGKPTVLEAGLGVWRLPDVVASPLELESWRAEHEAEMKRRMAVREEMGPSLR